MHCELCIKNIIFAPQNQALMSKHNSQIEEKIFKTSLKAKFLTYNMVFVPYPTVGRFEVEPSVENKQQTTDNSLRFWRLSLKKSYSKFYSQKSYLTNFYNACCRRDACCHSVDMLCYYFAPYIT